MFRAVIYFLSDQLGIFNKFQLNKIDEITQKYFWGPKMLLPTMADFSSQKWIVKSFRIWKYVVLIKSKVSDLSSQKQKYFLTRKSSQQIRLFIFEVLWLRVNFFVFLKHRRDYFFNAFKLMAENRRMWFHPQQKIYFIWSNLTQFIRKYFNEFVYDEFSS